MSILGEIIDSQAAFRINSKHREITGKMQEKTKRMGYALLIFPFLIISYILWLLIKNYTNYSNSIISLVNDKEFLFTDSFFVLGILGVLLFFVSLSLIKEIRKPALSFIFNLFLIWASIVALIGIFAEFFYEWFRIILILYSFIIYYTIYQVKKYFSI